MSGEKTNEVGTSPQHFGLPTATCYFTSTQYSLHEGLT